MYTHSIIIHSFRDKFVHFEQLLGIANIDAASGMGRGP